MFNIYCVRKELFRDSLSMDTQEVARITDGVFFLPDGRRIERDSPYGQFWALTPRAAIALYRKNLEESIKEMEHKLEMQKIFLNKFGEWVADYLDSSA